MKRVTAFLLMLALIMSLAAGCRNSGENNGEENTPPDPENIGTNTGDPSGGETGDPVTDDPENPGDDPNGTEGESGETGDGKNGNEDPPVDKPGPNENEGGTGEVPDEPTPPPSGPIQSKPYTATASKSGAEATIKTLYSNLSAGMSWETVWDKYVYSGSKSLGYSRGTFVSEKEEFQQAYGIRYKGFSVSSSSETKAGVFLVSGVLEYEANGETVRENSSDYLVYSGGEYYISLSGSALGAAVANGMSSFKDISCIDAVVKEYADRTVVTCTLCNISEVEYYIGSATGLPVTVWKNGESHAIVCASGKIEPGGYYALTVELAGYSGMPERLSIDKIIYLTDSMTGSGDTYTMDIVLQY